MASIYKRKSKDSKSQSWRAVVRIKGHPTVCETFDRKQEAEDWSKEVERQIKLGQYRFNQDPQKQTFTHLFERYISDGMLQHHKAVKDTLRHLEYWKKCFGAYALVHIDPDRISKERKILLELPTNKGQKRSPATVNRYIAALSSIFSFAHRQLRWISENPCSSLKKLKEAPGRDRVLKIEEAQVLIQNCKKSRCTYLYAIVLMAITTGMRQGEILGLKWTDIDFTNNLIQIRDSKNGRPRAVAMTEALKEAIMWVSLSKDDKKELVFASRTAFGKIDIKKPFKLALEQSNITGFCFHLLRHTFATLASQFGATHLQLSVGTGHRSLEMLQRYTHLDAEVTKRFSEQISELVS